jgi:hypothetical protein
MPRANACFPMQLSAISLIAALTTAGLAPAQTGGAFPDTVTADEGLVSRQVPGLNHVYARPGAELSRYTKIMLDPVEVSFTKSWDPQPSDPRVAVADEQTIKADLSKLLRQELRKALLRSGRYAIVQAAGEDVLRIKAEIRDLRLNAPDGRDAAEVRSFAISLGEIRLIAELRDAPTGALIARVVDFKKGPDSGWMKLARRIDSIADARRAAARWAQILTGQLDAAHDALGAS